MENGKPASERYHEIFDLINLLEFKPFEGSEIFSSDTGWTEQSFYRGSRYKGDFGRALHLKTNGNKLLMAMENVPRNNRPRFLMTEPMTEQDACYHFNKWGRALQRGRDYVIPSRQNGRV